MKWKSNKIDYYLTYRRENFRLNFLYKIIFVYKMFLPINFSKFVIMRQTPCSLA